MAVFWYGAPRSFVEIRRRFKGSRCLHHQSDKCLLTVKAIITSDSRSVSTRLHGATSHKTVSFIFVEVRTWNLTNSRISLLAYNSATITVSAVFVSPGNAQRGLPFLYNVRIFLHIRLQAGHEWLPGLQTFCRTAAEKARLRVCLWTHAHTHQQPSEGCGTHLGCA
jgi:hypothetical protein